jgi:hypothetical protein
METTEIRVAGENAEPAKNNPEVRVGSSDILPPSKGRDPIW